ncbi:integrase [Desulfomarina profundi]|uniref:Integrase n=1 Tax=Desulfomarina profundi TaxID=2772557 RepID=A0A8D5FJS7_9BACT|nr:site-specific integrase [Desulfomarina profundi]BCL59474.1 integrase [Desulfomarina profundi]
MIKNKINFTDTKLRKLNHDGSTKRLYFYDAGQPALSLCITPAGTKSFQFQAWDRARGKSVTKSIGKYPSVAINHARQLAANLLTEVNKGVDVIEAAKAIKNEDTLAVIFSRWLDVYAKPHKKSWDEDKRRYTLYIDKPLGSKPISWFSPNKIRKWHSDITKLPKQRGTGTITGTTANRALALLSTIFSQMAPERPNPCKSVKKFREQSRDRFLQPSELQRFFDGLAKPETPPTLRDYLLLSIYTGARRNNVMQMKWVDIDFDQHLWRIPASQSKNAEVMIVPLVAPAIQILKTRKAKTSSVFVFDSSRSKSGHIEEPKRAWKSLLKRANLSDVRIHDLRRTMGSYQTMTGASSTVVGKTLGHKSQSATAVYARLNLDPVRSSMEAAVEMMEASRELREKVVNIKEK